MLSEVLGCTTNLYGEDKYPDPDSHENTKKIFEKHKKLKIAVTLLPDLRFASRRRRSKALDER